MNKGSGRSTRTRTNTVNSGSNGKRVQQSGTSVAAGTGSRLNKAKKRPYKRKLWSKEDMRMAINLFKKGDITKTKASQKYNIPASTFSTYLNNPVLLDTLYSNGDKAKKKENETDQNDGDDDDDEYEDIDDEEDAEEENCEEMEDVEEGEADENDEVQSVIDLVSQHDEDSNSTTATSRSSASDNSVKEIMFINAPRTTSMAKKSTSPIKFFLNPGYKSSLASSSSSSSTTSNSSAIRSNSHQPLQPPPPPPLQSTLSVSSTSSNLSNHVQLPLYEPKPKRLRNNHSASIINNQTNHSNGSFSIHIDNDSSIQATFPFVDSISSNNSVNKNKTNPFHEYEKPLKIYNYIALRHRYHPLYLNRNLFYIKSNNRKQTDNKQQQQQQQQQQIPRKNKRDSFNIDELLFRKEQNILNNNDLLDSLDDHYNSFVFELTELDVNKVSTNEKYSIELYLITDSNFIFNNQNKNNNNIDSLIVTSYSKFIDHNNSTLPCSFEINIKNLNVASYYLYVRCIAQDQDHVTVCSKKMKLEQASSMATNTDKAHECVYYLICEISNKSVRTSRSYGKLNVVQIDLNKNNSGYKFTLGQFGCTDKKQLKNKVKRRTMTHKSMDVSTLISNFQQSNTISFRVSQNVNKTNYNNPESINNGPISITNTTNTPRSNSSSPSRRSTRNLQPCNKLNTSRSSRNNQTPKITQPSINQTISNQTSNKIVYFEFNANSSNKATKQLTQMAGYTCPFCGLELKSDFILYTHLKVVHFRFYIKQQAIDVSNKKEDNDDNLVNNGINSIDYYYNFCYRHNNKAINGSTTNGLNGSVNSRRSQNNNLNNQVKFSIWCEDIYDGSYVGNPYDWYYSAHLGYSKSRIKPMKRMSVTYIIVNKIKKCSLFIKKNNFLDLSQFAELAQSELVALKFILQQQQQFNYQMQPNKVFNCQAGMERVYYHTKTTLPILPTEIDNDSDNEMDPDWLKEQTSILINDFADVNEGEKGIMKLWNLHCLKHNFIGDLQIYRACETFIEEQALNLYKLNLVNNFQLHLANLFDYGLLKVQNMLKLIDLLNTKLSDIKNEQDSNLVEMLIMSPNIKNEPQIPGNSSNRNKSPSNLNNTPNSKSNRSSHSLNNNTKKRT